MFCYFFIVFIDKPVVSWTQKIEMHDGLPNC